MYDFDTEINRRNTDSLKWDVLDNELPLWVADMDFQTAPEIIKAITDRASHGIFGYSIVPEIWYRAYMDWWQHRHGLTIKREWLQFTTGIVPAISTIIQRVTNVGDNVAVMTPVYDIFFHSIENFGRHTIESKLIYDGNDYSIDFDDLERILAHPLTTLLILCNPHNPIGKIWNKDELKKIGMLCKKHGVIVISDEIHCDLTEPGTSYIPFASVSNDCADISITCISASKAFNLAGLQSAAVMIPNDNIRNAAVRGLNSNEVAEPNCFAVTATVAAFTKGEKWLEELNEYILQNKIFANRFLKNIPRVHSVKGKASYLMWIDCSAITNDADNLCTFLRKETGLFLSSGAQYRGNGNNFIRMNLACPRTRLSDALIRFKKGIGSYIIMF